MTKKRIRNLIKRAGVEIVPFMNVTNREDLDAALEQLGDAQLLDAWRRTIRARAGQLTDEQLLRELEEARQKESTSH